MGGFPVLVFGALSILLARVEEAPLDPELTAWLAQVLAVADQSLPDDRIRAGLVFPFRGRTAAAREALEKLVERGEAAIPVLARLLGHERAQVRHNAAQALGLLAQPDIVPPLLAALRDPNPGVRDQVAWALGRSGHPAALEALEELRQTDPDLKVRSQAGESYDLLAQVVKIDQRPTLEERIAGFVGLVKQGYAQIRLARIGEPAVEPLLKALHDPDLSLSVGAAQTLARIGDVRALEPIYLRFEASRQDGNGASVASYARALAEFRHPAVWPYLLRLLGSGDPAGEFWALQGIRRVPHEDRQEVVLAFLQKKVEQGEHRKPVRRGRTAENTVAEACQLLGDLGDARALPLLARVAQEAPANRSIVRSVARQSCEKVRAREGEGEGEGTMGN